MTLHTDPDLPVPGSRWMTSSANGFDAWPIGGQMGAVTKTEALASIRRSIELGSTLIATEVVFL